MKYRNAQEILPDKLLRELQRYVSGETLYIPSSQEKKSWGAVSGSRQYYEDRNRKIKEKFKKGISVSVLAEEFNLSVDSIKKIVYPSRSSNQTKK